MKIKRLKNLRVNTTLFKIKWDKEYHGGYFDYREKTIILGLKDADTDKVFMILCHELMEISLIEMSVRFNRPDCNSDYIFVYDHRQFDTAMEMFAGLLGQFIIV